MENKEVIFGSIPKSLKDKIKGKEKQLAKAISDLKEYAKKDLGE